ncbi:MAG: hypothetical protein KF813_09530 [Trueperaceae bacterium]|nr:hypothetical protein [Trueperaceae bacterium]
MNLTEVIVLIPEERVGEFYRLVGTWLTADQQAEEPAPTRGRRRRRATSEGMPVLSGSSRYHPLNKHLAGIPKSTKKYELSFDEINTIISAELPKSAYDHRAWWANTESHSQSLAWISAGWRVEGVDLDKQLINLVRAPN